MARVAFTKMQGLGNDFVVIDAIEQPIELSEDRIQQLSDRRFGIGFDQLLLIEAITDDAADYRFRIFNADGKEVEQCGNGARCVALYLKAKYRNIRSRLQLATQAGVLDVLFDHQDRVAVNMGVPQFNPVDIPFTADQNQKLYHLKLEGQTVALSVVNVGNPHAVIRVDQIHAEQVSVLGRLLSVHPAFPVGTNVGFIEVIDEANVRLKVFERGSGETLACGSGACAAMVVGRRNGWLQERVVVNQPGGALQIDWQGPMSPVIMTGPGKTVFEGVFSC